MYDPAQWLDEQLDEDERIARAATQGEWVWSREFVTPPGYHHRTVGPLEPGDAAYIAAHDPAGVLREIDAKREIVRDYRAAVGKLDEAEVGTPAHDRATGAVVSLRRAVCLLATTYDARPGFKEEWRP